MLATIINGLIFGVIYGLIAVGLVLVYKGARAFNFAQGEFGTAAVFVAWMLHDSGTPMALALLAGLAAAVAFGLAVERLVVRPLADAPRVTILVATAGVALASIYVQLILGEAEARVLPQIIEGDEPFYVLNAPVTWQNIFMIISLVSVAAGLYLFFSRTNMGIAVLATSQDTLASRLTGIKTARVSQMVWGMAAFLGGLAGLLQGAVTVFYPGFMTTTVLLPGFAAAVLGGMTSLPGAFLGGLLVGVVSNVGGDLIPDTIPGGGELVVFFLILLVLLIRPKGLLGKEA